MNEKQFEILCKKLDKITALLMIQKIENKQDQIHSLRKLGLTSEEVGEIVGIKKIRDKEGWKRK